MLLHSVKSNLASGKKRTDESFPDEFLPRTYGQPVFFWIGAFLDDHNDGFVLGLASTSALTYTVAHNQVIFQTLVNLGGKGTEQLLFQRLSETHCLPEYCRKVINIALE